MTRQRTPALVISFQETAQAGKADPGDETVLTAALDENGIGHGPCCVLEMF